MPRPCSWPWTPRTVSPTRFWKAFRPTTSAPPAPNAIIAHPLGIIQGVDHLFTGKVERVDTELLQTLLNQGIVPVVPPLGFDGDGKTYRANSDSIALAVAEALKAIKLIFITAQDGLRHNDQLIRQMLVGDLQKLVQSAPGGFARGNVFQGPARGCRLRRGRAARPHCQRPRGRRAARRSVLQRGHRHADLRQRIRTDPARPRRKTSGPSRC